MGLFLQVICPGSHVRFIEDLEKHSLCKSLILLSPRLR